MSRVLRPRHTDPLDCGSPDRTVANGFEWDLQIAAAVDLPVLISGGPAVSRDIACELDRRSRSPRGAVEVVDCRRADAVAVLPRTTQAGRSKHGRRPKILLLQEVHALGPDEQSVLARHLEHAHRAHPNRHIRILASSSVPLFDRVMNMLFDERLFYRLNVIHIIVPAAHIARPEDGH